MIAIELERKISSNLYILRFSCKSCKTSKRLKAFQKVIILPKQKKKVTFEISEHMLKFWDENLRYDSENGDFKTSFLNSLYSLIFLTKIYQTMYLLN